MASHPTLNLYSACSCYCLWIALAHKHLEYSVVPVNFAQHANCETQYSNVNSSARVPTLEVDCGKLSLKNNLTSLLWLEETFLERNVLLPPVTDW